MIPISKTEIINKLSMAEGSVKSGYNNLIKDILERDGYQTLAFLLKRGDIKVTKKELEDELNLMVEDNLLEIGQWEQMSSLLKNARNGEERIAAFFRKQRRFKIV